MRILMYKWKAYSDKFLRLNLEALGHEVVIYQDDTITLEEDVSLMGVVNKVKEGFDLAISYNYFKLIAIACNEGGIPYISWTQDSPMLSLYDKTTFFDTNYFFCFDSEQFLGMKKRGITNAFYFPLAVDCDALYSMACSASNEEMKRYRASISFVGSLYSERNMLTGIKGIPDYIKGYFDGVIQSQLQIPAVRYSQMKIAGNVREWLKSNLVFEGQEESYVSYDELIDNLLDREVTVQERRLMLKACQDFDFHLYTNSDTTKFPFIKNCGTVDYYTEMPKVFALTDINLNISLRSIRTGIPLRVLDVLACGGFLLTNAQPDLFLFFEEGRNIVTFQNLEEMKEKAIYYISHERERRMIAEEGRKCVKENFDFPVQLKKMFQILGLDK